MRISVNIERRMFSTPAKMVAIVILVVLLVVATPHADEREVIELTTINWEPYTGESLPDHGFFSKIVTEAFRRVGYPVKYQYRTWARAYHEAKQGTVHGLMAAYWKSDRTKYFSYPQTVLHVREEFIALRDNPIDFDGTVASLRGFRIGVLNASAQFQELKDAGLGAEGVSQHVFNVKKLMKKRIDAVLCPRSIFFYLLDRFAPEVGRGQIKILKPAYKTYDMYVIFSKKRSEYETLTADFNRGLKLIKADGTYDEIIEKNSIVEFPGETVPGR